MKIFDERKSSAEEISRLLKKKAFDEVELSPRVAAGTEKMFGQKLTAAQVVDRIVGEIRKGGDERLFYYTKLLDGGDFTKDTIAVTEKEFEEAEKAVDTKTMEAISRAISNVRKFHEEQLPKTWLTPRAYGSFLGQKMTPVDSVGIYVPGGTAAYPSSRDGRMNPYVLATARKIGITEIYKMGGAQAVAALAFGTETIPKVEKITGPGNIFVTLAKKAVYGHVDIDMLAGPSEILIVADQTGNPKYLAADLLSQAEHDPLACAILITCDEPLARAVAREVDEQLEALPRKEIAETSLAQTGKIILAKDMDTVVQMANLSAPEHMEIMTENAFSLVPRIRNAGAIFLGAYSPEPLGDYYAGPNHILPTGGTARFYSVLNVETFMKKTSLISYTREALKEAADDIIAMAEAEGLKAHANAIRVRKGEL